MENKRHLNQVESLRAIAALAVSIFHFSSYFEWNETASSNFTLGAQGVEVFYLISGFIIPYSLFHSAYHFKNYFSYMGKRLVRLMPPFIATIIGILCMDFFLSKVAFASEFTPDLAQVFVNIFFIADLFPHLDWINPIFATLEVELQFYLLIGLLFPLFRYSSWIFLLTSISLLALGWWTLETDTVLVNSPYFICGMSLFFIKQHGWKPQYYLPVVASFLLMIEAYYWEDVGAAAFGLLMILLLPNTIKFLRFSGRISYSYYLVHGLTGGWFLYFTSKTEFAIENPLLMMFSAILISWLFAFSLYWLIERPSIRLSKRIKYK